MQKAQLGKTNLSYLDKGKGLPLLFIHGFPFHSAAWEKQIELFSAECRVIAPDLRGFGGSLATGTATTMSEYADDLNNLLSYLDIASAVVVGHSMGGYVALNFASRYAVRTMGLVLVATKPGPDTPDAAKKREENALKAHEGGGEAILNDMAPKMLSQNRGSDDRVTLVKELMSPFQAQGLANALRGMAARPDSTPLLSALAIPTLVISGDSDALIPAEESMKMAPQIPGAELSLIAGAGHLVAFERPVEFNAVLKRWLTRFL